MYFSIFFSKDNDKDANQDSDEENDQPGVAKRARFSDLSNPNWYTKLSQEVRQRIMFPDSTGNEQSGSSGSMTSDGQIYLSPDVQVFVHFIICIKFKQNIL